VTLLARVGEKLYWAARRLERAEGVARVVREHSHLLADMPVSVPLTWEPLLEMAGDTAAYRARFPEMGEASIVGFLVGGPENPDGIVGSIGRARDSLRTCREIIPEEAWVVVNDLYLYVSAHDSQSLDRGKRLQLFDRVIADHQRFLGILLGNMTRDEAFTLMRLGRHVERAALTSRVLDVGATPLLGPPSPERHDEVRWIGLLRSLSALHMYHRAVREPVSGASVMRFLLREPAFPRSVAYCLDSMLRIVEELPDAGAVAGACAAAAEVLDGLHPRESSAEELHAAARALTMAIGAIEERIAETWFLAAPSA
jgi:uncharacterized alpha-E superfamily protein